MKWEYRFEMIDNWGQFFVNGEYGPHVNELGAVGWELVSIFVVEDETIAALKRQIPTEVKPG